MICSPLPRGEGLGRGQYREENTMDQNPGMTPTVSVIVPVRNEARSIERTLRSLLAQDFSRDRFEVIVADGVSTDATVPIVRRLQAEFRNRLPDCLRRGRG